MINSNAVDVKEEVPTARFWLMTKMKLGWEKKWEIYTKDLRKRIMDSIVEGPGESLSETQKKQIATNIIEKVERSAWATMPAPFLASMKVERVLHR
jgi:hypothetical protein